MKIVNKLINVTVNNLFETFIVIGTIFLFIGMLMIYKPMAFVLIGLISMLLAVLIYKNQ